MSRKDLLTSQEYVTTKIQLSLLDLIENYRIKKQLTQTGLSEELGVSKGYISQLLRGTYDHKISKLVELALSCNYMPILKFIDLDEYVTNDSLDKIYELKIVNRSNETQSTQIEAKSVGFYDLKYIKGGLSHTPFKNDISIEIPANNLAKSMNS